MHRTIESMPPDIRLWDYGPQLSGHNVFQGYMSCNNQFALFFSFIGLRSGLQVLEWNVPGTTWPSDGTPRTPVPGPASCHCRIHSSRPLPGTDTSKTMPVRSACGRSWHPPAYQQVPPKEGKREERRSKEKLSKWSPAPGSLALASQPALSNRASFQAPAQPLQNEKELFMYMQMPRWEGRPEELALAMQGDHRERAEVMSNSLLCFFPEEKEAKGPGPRAEVRANCTTQKKHNNHNEN